MPESGIEETAKSLLVAFNELSGGKPATPVPLRSSGATGGEEAVARAGLEPASPECAVAARYLVDQGYIRDSGDGASYELTATGVERIRDGRMPGDRKSADREGKGRRMSDKTQKRLMTVLAVGMTVVMSQPLTNYIERAVPERRGIRDDLLEAVLQGIVRTAAFFIASIFMRNLADRLNQ